MLLLPPGSFDLTIVEKDLTFFLKNFANPKQKITVTFYERHPDGGVWVPRFYGLTKFANVLELPIVSVPMQSALQINGELMETTRRPQVTVFNHCICELQSKGGAMVILPCGTGKTNIAIAVACSLGLKTAVICHQNFLMNQWTERFESFTTGKVKVGRLQQDTIDTLDKDVVMCSIHSILSRDYDKEHLTFGLIIVDEAHHITAPTFSRVLQKLHYQYSLGLTATPYRADNLEKVIYSLVGQPCYTVEREKRPDVQVNLIKHSSGHQTIIQYKNGVVGSSRMVTMLTEEKQRNELLLKVINAMDQEGRKGLLLSDRVAHLEYLHQRLGTDKSAIICGKINTDPPPNKTDAPVFNKFLTLSTFHMFSEAVDFNGNFIILATPRSRVEQCTGRILRGHSTIKPVIIDIVDPYSIFHFMAEKRQTYYRSKCGYEIIHLNDSDL